VGGGDFQGHGLREKKGDDQKKCDYEKRGGSNSASQKGTPQEQVLEKRESELTPHAKEKATPTKKEN